MYTLMKSHRLVLDHMVYGPIASYRQAEIGRFHDLLSAVAACELADTRSAAHHYVLNGAGQEYYAGTWIT